MRTLPFRLLCITNRQLIGPRSLITVIEKAVSAGVKAVQLREKDLPASELFDLAVRLADLCHRRNATLLINERFDIAKAVQAGGVHLPAHSIPAAVVRKHLPQGSLIGVSTHSLQEAQQAEQNGSDYILFGPVFPTPEKRKYGPPHGLAKLTEVASTVNVPVIAVGGITPERAGRCVEAGAAGVAVISTLMGATDLNSRVLELKEALGGL